jgi:hypothetical protein
MPPPSPSAIACTRPGERVLVVTDEPLRTIGYALRQAAVALGHEVVLSSPRRTNGEEPPRSRP